MKTGRESKGQRREPKVETKGQGDDLPPVAASTCCRQALIWRWFISKTVRHATAMRKHVHRMVCAQRDLLSSQALLAVSSSVEELQKAICAGAKKNELLKRMEDLETAANKWLRPYPNAAWRENVEVLLVALAVAMGIRTFFLQPFKIPTGSMQPTLYGITSVPDHTKPAEFGTKETDFEIPSGFSRVLDWFAGSSYVIYKADENGTFEGMSRPLKLLIFNLKQTVWLSGRPHTLWFPPDGGTGQPFRAGGILRYLSALVSSLPPDDQSPTDLERRMGLHRGTSFLKGQDVLRIKVISGDHLFVDRVTYNFRKPTRGEIIVFETSGTPIPQQDTFYIKRLVALGGECVQIGDDRHLVINGHRLDASTPHFENVYSFDSDQQPRESQYSGHVNNSHLAPYFSGQPDGVVLPEGQYMVMGDNTINSSDSRSWGSFSESKVIGKSYFVYWPITSRFGWGHR